MRVGIKKRAPLRVAGVGINATDTIIRLPRFPAVDSKLEVLSSSIRAGGQTASAMVACRRWGLGAVYVGKVGDDAAAKFQIAEMKRERVRAHWIRAKKTSSQNSYILVDQPSGERTILWQRAARITIAPRELHRRWLSGAGILLVDGHDTASATLAARWARQEKALVVADLDNVYPGVEALLEIIDFPVVSKDFPHKLTGQENVLESLPAILARFNSCAIVATLGRLGALAWDGQAFLLSPGFQADAMDTTGAGDIFHGAFVFGLARAWPLAAILEFACAAAALNCTAIGARGHIGTLREIAALRRSGRRSELAWSGAQLVEAARAAGVGVRPAKRFAVHACLVEAAP